MCSAYYCELFRLDFVDYEIFSLTLLLLPKKKTIGANNVIEAQQFNSKEARFKFKNSNTRNCAFISKATLNAPFLVS